MKKAKLLLFPLSVLLLSGCTFNDVKSWVGKNIYFPVKNFIEDIITPDNKEEGKEEGKEDEKETWTVVTVESVLADYTTVEDAPYKHVTLDFSVNMSGATAQGHCIYNLDETDGQWKLDTEQSTGTAPGETLEGYQITDAEINTLATLEGATVKFQKSNLGRYQVDVSMSYAEDNFFVDKLVFDKYFYVNEYTEDSQNGESVEQYQQTYVWSE